MSEELREFIDKITNMYHDSLLVSIVAEVTGNKVIEPDEVEKMKKDEEILK